MLSILSLIYGKIAEARNRLYENGVFESHDLGVRTVSIGNITTGGTGKTPLVAYASELLSARGEKVCILTRGYGRKDPGRRILISDGEHIYANAEAAGDEPFELAQKLIGKAIVIADRDRISAASWAYGKFDFKTLVLDDGFQHRRAKRDVDIVCIDATDPFGGGKMLPAGRLRELPHNLKRANIIVITRSDLAGDVSNLMSEIADLSAGTPLFLAQNKIVRISGIGEFQNSLLPTDNKNEVARDVSEKALDETQEHRVFAFCGVGNPNSFFDQIKKFGVSLTATQTYPDHHRYSSKDLGILTELASESGATALITTAKDAVKLSNLKFQIPCFVVEIETVIDNAEAFAALI